MVVYQISNNTDIKKLFRTLQIDSGGIKIMQDKTKLWLIAIKNLDVVSINILKQDALSIGAEVATPSGVITHAQSHFDCVLIANTKQLKTLANKELAQPFGLKRVARELAKFLESKHYPNKIMGILNVNRDSFYEKSRIDGMDIIAQIETMMADGADIVDIGAISSRPFSDVVDEDEEMRRLTPLLERIQEDDIGRKVTLSIDSHTPSVVQRAFEVGFEILNDITGGVDNKLLDLVAKHNKQICLMHMQGTPQTMQLNPSYGDVMGEINEFFEVAIQRCIEHDIPKERIILDIGIGFGKTLEHNLTLIKNLSHFQKFGCQILVGASRKGLINEIIPTPIEERLAGTLALHLEALRNGANIIRCHDVAAHKQAMSVLEALDKI